MKKNKSKNTEVAQPTQVNSITLYTGKNHREVFTLLDKLTGDFKRNFKKLPNTSLVYGLNGANHLLSVWHENTREHSEEIEWFRKEIKSEISKQQMGAAL